LKGQIVEVWKIVQDSAIYRKVPPYSSQSGYIPPNLWQVTAVPPIIRKSFKVRVYKKPVSKVPCRKWLGE
jgi:hypothetical protein